MRQLADYELANLAMWSFDYDQATSFFNAVIENSSEKTDLLATWGAVEGSIIMSESKARTWEQFEQNNQGMESVKPHLKRPVAGLIEERDRVKRFESVISAKEKEIIRNLQRHKIRLRNSLPREVYENASSDRASGQLTKKVNDRWFIAVQRLVSMCVGRSYRRDGQVPEIASVQRTLQGAGLIVKNSDDRCIVISKDGMASELWFDGRLCCTGPGDRFHDVLAFLELMTRVSDSALSLCTT